MQRSSPPPKQHVIQRRFTSVQPDGTNVFAWQSPSGRQALARVRMVLSLFGEVTNIGTNALDHAVRAAERLSFREKYLPARLRQYTGQRTVAFLLHGYCQGRGAFDTMERVLSSPIFDLFPVILNYQPYSQDIRRSAERMRQTIEWVVRHTDAPRVALIGHSQGGLVIRDILQRQAYTERVRHAVFLATPHMGTWAGHAGRAHRVATRVFGTLTRRPIVGESGLQMVPGSAYLNELNIRALPPGITYTNIYNYLDPLVWPARFARLPYPIANNILVMKIGHLQMLYDLQELEMILRTLLAGRLDGDQAAAEVIGAPHVLEARAIEGEDGGRYGEVVASSG